MGQGTKQHADCDGQEDLQPCLQGILGERSVSIAKGGVGDEEGRKDEEVIVGDGGEEEGRDEAQ